MKKITNAVWGELRRYDNIHKWKIDHIQKITKPNNKAYLIVQFHVDIKN